MSGHSKWSQIKHKKGVSDQKKGQLFSKLSKVITIAARQGVDPVNNLPLQTAIERARALNMPKDNIERAIKKAGERESMTLNKVLIQAMGPGTAAIIIQAITDNKNRTINELRTILAKYEAKMVGEGSLNWLFDKNWVPRTPLAITDPAITAHLEKLFAELDDHPDVENIYTNLTN